jgi:tetratricopeptide (TPR) repeat protein
VITGISIRAYASPEGTYEENLALSKKRAKALLDYIRGKYRLSAQLKVFSEGYGEDWDRLVDLIKADPKVENRTQIMDIIRRVDIFDGREKQIMDIAGGRPYLYMLDKLFPLLRRSDYRIEYTVPSFSVEKGIQLLKIKPSMLSPEEMYLIANIYEQGSEAFNEVFKMAGKTYPDDPSVWNNLGIIYMSESRLDEAEQYLQKAKEQGIKEAAHNLRILEELRKK